CRRPAGRSGRQPRRAGCRAARKERCPTPNRATNEGGRRSWSVVLGFLMDFLLSIRIAAAHVIAWRGVRAFCRRALDFPAAVTARPRKRSAENAPPEVFLRRGSAVLRVELAVKAIEYEGEIAFGPLARVGSREGYFVVRVYLERAAFEED